jgi:hypothetical protein
MARRDLVQTSGRDEDDRDMTGFRFPDDLADPGVAPLFLDEDLVDALGGGPERLEKGIDPDDPVHAGSGAIIC